MELYDIETDTEVYKRGIHILPQIIEKSSPEDVFKTVYDKTKELLKTNKFLTFFGGEHSISIGIIKAFYEKYKDITIKEIVREMFSYADGMTMSAKKDGLVNMGGFIALNSEEVFKKATVFNIMYEGFISYGGLNGRDMGALAVGLDEATEFNYLETRIGQVAYLGKQLVEYGIPVQQPFGGHAIFLDANKFVPTIPRNEYRAQALAIELYIIGGIRGVEIGTILADRDPFTQKNRYPELELVRLAIPRRTYSLNHMEYVAAVLKNIFDSREDAKRGYKIIDEAPIMRHFTVKLEKL